MFLIHCNEKPKDKHHFNRIHKLIEDNDIMIELDKYFKTLDLLNYNVTDIPMTEYKKENVLYNLPAYIQMIRDNPEIYKGRTFSAKELYNLSKEYAKNKRLSYSYTERKCFNDLGKFFGRFYQRTEKARRYVFPDNLEGIIDDEVQKNL